MPRPWLAVCATRHTFLCKACRLHAASVGPNTRLGKSDVRFGVRMLHLLQGLCHAMLFLMNPRPLGLLVQTLGQNKEDLKSETRHLMNLGFAFFGIASPKSAKGNPLGGVGIAVKNHLGPRILVTFHASQGCGYVIVALRSKGVDFNWISLYLESGTGLDSPVNDLILSNLTQHLSLLHGMWVVGGDFNVPIQDFLNSRYEERWQGRVVGSGSPTAGGESEIDFFVVHPSLQALSTVRLSFDTPFKPHGLLSLEVPVHSLQLRVPTIRSVVSPAPSSFQVSPQVQLVQILDVASQ